MAIGFVYLQNMTIYSGSKQYVNLYIKIKFCSRNYTSIKEMILHCMYVC